MPDVFFCHLRIKDKHCPASVFEHLVVRAWLAEFQRLPAHIVHQSNTLLRRCFRTLQNGPKLDTGTLGDSVYRRAPSQTRPSYESRSSDQAIRPADKDTASENGKLPNE